MESMEQLRDRIDQDMGTQVWLARDPVKDFYRVLTMGEAPKGGGKQ